MQDLKAGRALQVRERVQKLRRAGRAGVLPSQHPVDRHHLRSRRVLYELRAARDYFTTKERCVFCDILAQETSRPTCG